MNRLNLHISLGSIRGMFVSFEHPDFTWKITVWVVCIGAIIIGGLGVLSYNWSIAVETPKDMSTEQESQISATEIRSVIDLYKTKQKRFEELKRSRPVPPSLSEGAGAAVPTSLVPTSSSSPEAIPGQ